MRTPQISRLCSVAAAAVVGAAALTLVSPTPADAADWAGVELLGDQTNSPENLQVAYLGDGDAVAVWLQKDGADYRVRSASAEAGDWRPPVWVSDENEPVSDPVLAANENGDVVVGWSETDNGGDLRLRAARRLTVATWDGSTLLTPFDTELKAAELGVAANGRVIAASQVEVDGVQQVMRTEWPEGQNAGEPQLVETDAVDPSLDVNDAGEALLGWTALNDQHVSIIRRSTSGTWSSIDPVSSPGSGANQPAVAIADNGFGVALWTADFQGNDTVQSVKVQTNASTGGSSFVSNSAENASAPSVDITGNGLALATWLRNGSTGVGYATQPQTGSWARSTLTTPGSPDRPIAAISDDGTQAISYAASGRQMIHYRTNPIQIFTIFDSGTGYHDLAGDYSLDAGEDGNLVAGVLKTGAPAAFATPQVRFLDQAGPVTSLDAVPAFTTTPKIPLAWTSSDDISGVTGSTVLRRTSAWNQPGFTDYASVLQAAGSPVSVTGLAGTTQCFQVQSRDGSSNFGPRSVERCTTLPLDDVSLVGGKVWSRQQQKGAFLGTVTVTKQKNAVLRRGGVDAKRLALVVTKTANGGKVVVRMGTQVLKTVNLKGKGKRVVVPVATFENVRSGKVTIKVVSPTGKQVRIDGLLVAK